MTRKIRYPKKQCRGCGDWISTNALGRAAHQRHCTGIARPVTSRPSLFTARVAAAVERLDATLTKKDRAMTGPCYRPLLRPASRYTLPDGMRWEYVEEPAMHGLANRPDLPRSMHRYGVIRTDRALTPDEREHFDLLELVP